MLLISKTLHVALAILIIHTLLLLGYNSIFRQKNKMVKRKQLHVLFRLSLPHYGSVALEKQQKKRKNLAYLQNMWTLTGSSNWGWTWMLKKESTNKNTSIPLSVQQVLTSVPASQKVNPFVNSPEVNSSTRSFTAWSLRLFIKITCFMQ